MRASPNPIRFLGAAVRPCRIAPVVERLARELAGRLKVVKLDVAGAQEVAARHNAQSIPLLVLFPGGEELDRLVGTVPEPQLRQWLEQDLPPRRVPSRASGPR